MKTIINNSIKESNNYVLIKRIKIRMFLIKERRKAYKAKDKDKVGSLSYLMKVNLDNFSLDEIKKLANENLFDLSGETILD